MIEPLAYSSAEVSQRIDQAVEIGPLTRPCASEFCLRKVLARKILLPAIFARVELQAEIVAGVFPGSMSFFPGSESFFRAAGG